MLFPWTKEENLEREVAKLSDMELRVWMIAFATPSVFATDVQSKAVTIMTVLAEEHKRRAAAKESK